MNRKPARHAAPALLAAVALFGAASAQSLELEDCRIGAGPGFPSIKARCATMPRPLNPEDPDSPVIGIRVAVVAALDLNPEPDPVVPIAGGPGQGSVEFYLQTRAAFENLRRDRDILLVDQRGTGESARMDCDVDADIVLYETDYSLDETVEFMRDCLDALPYDPRYFTTSVAVTDLEAIREALGYPELNLYGVSYGSRVAQHFARRFPDSTRTVVVDGVLPPQIALGPEIATESQKAVDGVLARCAADPDCNERFPGIEDTFVRVVSELRAGPVEVTVPHPSTGRPETFSFGPGQFAG
ncbi:MAG: alpha/beta hydrolase, partial [Proteobacteria bacterium]|nr:alpha/beta hydrolase [Pseudomonadota bacterium]